MSHTIIKKKNVGHLAPQQSGLWASCPRAEWAVGVFKPYVTLKQH